MPKKMQGKRPVQKQMGEATAKRMKQKLADLKSKRKDEDIQSDSENDGRNFKEDFLTGMNSNLENDEVMKETAEEKRLRMTKDLIGEYAVDDKQNFFANLMAKTSTDMDIIRQDDEEVVKRMKLKMLE